MRTIYKYELDITDGQKVTMPASAELLYVAGQPDGFGGVPLMLWALVDTSQPTVDRLIAVVGTGNPAPEPWQGKYVGSAICGPFVWHVFDGGPS